MQSSWRRNGLTLIELLVVVTLMAFVAATVTVKLSGRISSASLNQAVSVLIFTDGQLRQHARRQGRPITLQVSVGTNRLEFTNGAELSDKRAIRTLGRGVAIKQFRSATREVTFGSVAIAYSDRGCAETFAIELVGSSGKRWILFAGITGQATELSNEQEVEEIMARLLPAGVHAG